MEDEAKEAVRDIINYEYRVCDTPKYTVVDETWELVDVLPKPRSNGTIYLMVFRRTAPHLNSRVASTPITEAKLRAVADLEG